MLVIRPVQVHRQQSVRAGLACVFRGRLTVHLKDRAAGFADHAADQVDVVDLYGGGRGLVRLVDALQHRGHQSLGSPENAGGLADVAGVDLADLRCALHRVGVDRRAERVKPCCVLV